jgi:K+-sensing histidine kinase KdpD
LFGTFSKLHEIPHSALDFSHSNPEFCHPKSSENFLLLPAFMTKTCMRAVADKLRTLEIVDAAIGGALCGIAAIAASAVASGHTWKTAVPLIFTAILLLNARLFGTRAGLLGTVLSALVFAGFLFGPTGSIQVANDSARSNLGWMLLIGIGFSFLFAPPTSGFRRH